MLILLESGRKGDSGDGAGAHGEITQEPHTRRREALDKDLTESLHIESIVKRVGHFSIML